MVHAAGNGITKTDGSLKEYTVSMDNDFAIFRYADVVLMYVESFGTTKQNKWGIQLADFKKIRTRAGLDAYTTSQLTIDELYAERGRELAWEGWRMKIWYVSENIWKNIEHTLTKVQKLLEMYFQFLRIF